MRSMLSRLIALETASPAGTSIADDLRAEWSAPPDVLSVLLLLGGDVVQASLAQLTGGLLTPAVFSFGWVSYAVTALRCAVGDDRLMPPVPDFPCTVINGESGYARDNRSWMIGRLMRDFDFWKDPNVKVEEEQVLVALRKKSLARGLKGEPRVPLTVTFYNAVLSSNVKHTDADDVNREDTDAHAHDVTRKNKAGIRHHDFIWYFSYVTILVQLALAAVPAGLYNNWAILMVTGAGTLMAWITAALPQWREEKVGACRKESKKTFVITGGNGTKDVIVIRGRGVGLDLEDLAAGSARMEFLTRAVLGVLAVLWIALLITVAGIKKDTWFLFGVGGIGMLHNILVSALPGRPGAYGIHLEYERTVVREKVMKTLQAVEDLQPALGASLLPIFFPGELRDDEIKWWVQAKARAKAGMHSAPAVVPSPAVPPAPHPAVQMAESGRDMQTPAPHPAVQMAERGRDMQTPAPHPAVQMAERGRDMQTPAPHPAVQTAETGRDMQTFGL